MMNATLTRSLQGLIFGVVPGAATGAALGFFENKNTTLEYAKKGAIIGLLFTPGYTHAAKLYSWNHKPLAGLLAAQISFCNAVCTSCINDLKKAIPNRE